MQFQASASKRTKQAPYTTQQINQMCFAINFMVDYSKLTCTLATFIRMSIYVLKCVIYYGKTRSEKMSKSSGIFIKRYAHALITYSEWDLKQHYAVTQGIK